MSGRFTCTPDQLKAMFISTLQNDSSIQADVRQILDANAKFQSQLDEIQTSVNDQNKRLDKLEERIEDQERYSRSFCLRFVGFQEDK
ncbi:unnamed protein product, partial [Didymodactylos carnosus]